MHVHAPTLLVADSFRVRAGTAGTARGTAVVRGWPLHLARFRVSVIALSGLAREGASSVKLDAFLADATEQIAAYGNGFPRLELWGSPGATTTTTTTTTATATATPELRLNLRPLPALITPTVKLRTAPNVTLATPGTKGPNIALLADLNRELGAEALLTDAAGYVLEGATTSFIWWDRDTGHVAAQQGGVDRVASITEALLSGAARHSATPLRPTLVTPADLARHEVWAVNALHGIRVVTAIDGVALPAPDLARLRAFRALLDHWTPLTS
jgi:branched-subunit amino acid aminotransferase/4-amino-4-deoxychorismate lyase